MGKSDTNKEIIKHTDRVPARHGTATDMEADSTSLSEDTFQ